MSPALRAWKMSLRRFDEAGARAPRAAAEAPIRVNFAAELAPDESPETREAVARRVREAVTRANEQKRTSARRAVVWRVGPLEYETMLSDGPERTLVVRVRVTPRGEVRLQAFEVVAPADKLAAAVLAARAVAAVSG